MGLDNAVAPDNPLPEIVINNRYILHETIGHGGMGIVYRATDRLSGGDVALKQVLAAPLGQAPNADSPERTGMRLALAREFAFLASLRHPQIISVLDYGFDSDGYPYFTMDLLSQPDNILKAGQGQPLKTQISLIVQTLQALGYLHRRGILHRDLKPDNIQVVDNRVKLLDFGLSVEHEQTSEVGGTLAYMAPEILQGKPATPLSDLYSLGVIFYELLVGHHPFQDTAYQTLLHAILEDMPDMDPLYLDPAETKMLNTVILSGARDLPVPDISTMTLMDAGSQLAMVLERLLAKDPRQRYGSAAEVTQALDRVVAHGIPFETSATRESFLQAANFVGRTAELSQLTTALEKAAQGQGSCWLVAGESGVGKTRLLEELRINALVRGIPVLRGQGTREGGKPYQYWRNILRRMVLSTPIEPLEAGVLQSVIPDITNLVEVDVPAAAPLDASESQRRLLAVIEAVFRKQTQPLVVIVEDLQWASESLPVFTKLSQLAPGLPLLLLGAYRDDERPGLPDELGRVQVIKLERLQREEIAALSSVMLGPAGSEAGVVDLLERTSEGNVFFLVEVVRELAEQAGQLDKIGQMELPEQVFAGGARQIVQARLAGLDTATRSFLYYAAAAGRQLDLDLLRTVIGTDIEIHLNAGARAALLTLVEQQWQFAHDQLRTGLLAEVDNDMRRVIHRRLARTIEQLYGESEDYVNPLYHHWHMAGDAAREVHYAILAGQQRLSISHFSAARDVFERALVLAEAQTDNAATLARIYCYLGEVHWRTGEHFRAGMRLKKSLELAQGTDDRHILARAWLNQGIVQMRTGEYRAAIDSLGESLAVARRIDDRAGVARTLSHMGAMARRLGQFELAERYLRESLDTARAIDAPATLAYALDNLGLLALLRGHYVVASDYFTESLALLERIRDQAGLGTVLHDRGQASLFQGQLDAARRDAQRSHTIAEAVGNKAGVANSLLLQGTLAIQQQDFAGAKAFIDSAAFIYRTVSDWEGIGSALMMAGLADLRMGNSAAALTQLEESLRIFERLEDVDDAAQARAFLGLARLAAGDSDTARHDLLEALRTARTLSTMPLILIVLVALANWYLQTGDPGMAAAILDPVLDQPTIRHGTRQAAAALRAAIPEDTPVYPFTDQDALIRALLNLA